MLDPAGVNCSDMFDKFEHDTAMNRLTQIENENMQIRKDLKKLSKKVTHLEKKIQKLKKTSK